jgi:uncharacterized membrane protein HdeD (DUF308 family)
MRAENFAEHLVHHWWVWAVRGLAAVLFGLTAFAWPGITLAVLIWLFGAYALVGGVFTLVSALKQRSEYREWWLLLLSGVASVGVGLITYFSPAITGGALLYLIAAWAVVTGAFEIAAAVRWHHFAEHTGLFLLSGILSVAFGVLAMVFPTAGALGIVWMIGVYAVAFGVLQIGFGFRMRHLGALFPGERMHPA